MNNQINENILNLPDDIKYIISEYLIIDDQMKQCISDNLNSLIEDTESFKRTYHNSFNGPEYRTIIYANNTLNSIDKELVYNERLIEYLINNIILIRKLNDSNYFKKYITEVYEYIGVINDYINNTLLKDKVYVSNWVKYYRTNHLRSR